MQDCLGDRQARDLLEPPRSGPGRPPDVSALALWSSLLLCLLRGERAILEVWRLLRFVGLWEFPKVAVDDMAIYNRLKRTPPHHLEPFFERLSALLRERLDPASATPYAAFATAIYALDQSVLDPLFRKLKLLREFPKGDHRLLPGVLVTLFDLRRQQWAKVQFSTHALQNEKPSAPGMVADLPPGCLLLFDLGYFSFFWFDYLMERGLWYVSRLREKASYQVLRVLVVAGDTRGQVRESLVYLGKHDADRAGFPVRLIEVTVGTQTWRYLTNVLDPRVLPAWEVVGLYGFRWDVETAFNVLKTHLGLHLIWSGHPHALLHQVYATLLLSQMVLALRFGIAAEAGCDVREVSLELMLRWLPRLGGDGKDAIREFVTHGRAAGFIRPFRGRERHVPRVEASAYDLPEHPPPLRRPRYGETPRAPEHQRLMDQLRARVAAASHGG